MTLVARLKVTLSDVEPQVLRRFDVPLKIKLNRLHEVIQAAMGWTDSHLYEFRAGGVGWPGACRLPRRPLPLRTGPPQACSPIPKALAGRFQGRG